MPGAMDPRADDLDLALKAADGEPEAVSELVERFGPLMARAVRGVVGARPRDRAGDVEDLVAEAFLKMFDEGGALLRGFRGDSALGTYLVAVTRKTALAGLRKGLVRTRGRVPYDALQEPAQDEVDAPEGPSLEAILPLLSERDRMVLSLRYVEELTLRQVAERCGVAPGTASSWVLRARRRLREAWGRAPKSGNRL